MLKATLQIERTPGAVEDAVVGYQRAVEAETGALAARVMASGMIAVPEGHPPSRPGQFPFSRTGSLKNQIRAASDGESFVVGPETTPPPAGYSYSGASTVAEALNKGATAQVRQRVRSRGRTRTRVRRFTIKPRPFVELTLQIIASKMAAIAQRTPIKRG